MSIFKNRSNVISYTVNKEIGSNCYVSVDGGEVVVNAPWYFSRRQIQTVIEEKKQWILNKIEEYDEKMVDGCIQLFCDENLSEQ